MDGIAEALRMPPSAGYIVYAEEELNRLGAYCRALDEYEDRILRLTGRDLTALLLSKYYWRSRMEALHERLHGSDGGFSQYTYQAIEELDRRAEDMDWRIVERLDREIAGEDHRAGGAV